MRTTWFVALGAALLLVLVPDDAGAVDGTITGVKANPNPADVNQDVVITVLGTQKCKKVSIDFGDNTPPGILNNPDFENNDVDEDSVIHPYTADNIYVVYVTAVEQCSGSAQMTVTVGTGGGNGGGNGGNGGTDDKIPAKWKGQDPLCGMLANCQPGASMRPEDYRVQLPHLEALFPFSVIEPGGDVIVLGQQFGKTQGELHMFLKTDQKDVKLQIKEWSDGHVGGTIPVFTIGVLDQKAEFYVKSSNGLESNHHGDAGFTAKRGIEILPRSDVSVVQCGFDANCDRCLTTTDPEEIGCYGGTSRKTGTISALHARDFLTVGNAEGTDTYKPKASLKNGWELHNTILEWGNQPAGGEKSASVSFTSSQIKVDWWVSPHDTLWYDVYVMIKGPMGTPH